MIRFNRVALLSIPIFSLTFAFAIGAPALQAATEAPHGEATSVSLSPTLTGTTGDAFDEPDVDPGSGVECDTCRIPWFDKRSVDLLTLAGAVFLHEFGHFATANLLGSPSVAMDFLPFRHGIGSGLARTYVDVTGLSAADRRVIALAGSGTSRILGEGIHQLANLVQSDTGCPAFGERIVSSLFIRTRFDYLGYVATDAVLDILGLQGGDMQSFVDLTAGESTGGRIAVYIGMIGVGVLDIWLDLDRIGRHLQTVEGIRCTPSEESGTSMLRFAPSVSGEGVGVMVWGTF